MRRAIALFAAVGVALVGMAGSSASGKATKTVDLGDDFFDPLSLTIKEKTRVDFNWIGEDDHNVRKGDGPGKYFESETYSEPGVNFSHVFRKPGRYKLVCGLHDEMKMDLRVKRRR